MSAKTTLMYPNVHNDRSSRSLKNVGCPVNHQPTTMPVIPLPSLPRDDSPLLRYRILISKILSMDRMLHVDLGTLEPLPRTNRIPQHRNCHYAEIHEDGVVHIQIIQIRARVCRKAEDRNDECDPRAGDVAAGFRPASEVPWPCREKRVSNCLRDDVHKKRVLNIDW